jgi:hypothetical protein
MKKLLVLILTVLFCAVSLAAAEKKVAKPKPESRTYTGTVKEKVEHSKRFVLQTQESTKEFLFVPSGKDGCLAWKDVVVETYVDVTCREKKRVLEATCVSPHKPSMQGVEMRGVEIR